MGYLESLMGAREKIALKERQHWMVIVPRLVLWGAVSVLIFLITVVLAANVLDGLVDTDIIAIVIRDTNKCSYGYPIVSYNATAVRLSSSNSRNIARGLQTGQQGTLSCIINLPYLHVTR